jgi:hypothetical protein
MKLRLVIVMLLVTFQGAYSQQQTVIAKFIIQTAARNHVDVSQQYTTNKSYFVFYITADKEVNFGSIVPGTQQQSYGAISNLTHTSIAETPTQYATDTFDFSWAYSNTYDNHQGTANVHVVKIDKPGGIEFILKIVPETLDLLEYKGYMEGSLKLD